jgi:dTDP-4-amino-4,6-dideoxygalactose transaminase
MSLVPHDDAPAVRSAIDRVIARGWFILGPEVEAFEQEFAAASGAAHAVAVGTGTDAIALILRALGIGPGDEVNTTPLSAAYSALAIMMAGARPVFADIDPVRLTLDPQRVADAIGPRTRAILPVHLYGQAADMPAIGEIAARHGLAIVEDCCQAHLATAGGRPVGTIGIAGAFSFYPTKNLGALGDGGAVCTNDAEIAERVRSLRHLGQRAKGEHRLLGYNERLDGLQAALLRVKLPHLDSWNAARRRVAAGYRERLEGHVRIVEESPETPSIHHLFPIRVPERERFAAQLGELGVQTGVHYSPAVRDHAALEGRVRTPADLTESAAWAAEELSLPMFAELRDDEVERAAAACLSAVGVSA